MFRFTIRDVLWLTVVVACVLGWWNERLRGERAGEWVQIIREELWKEGRDLQIDPDDRKARILNEKYSSEGHP